VPLCDNPLWPCAMTGAVSCLAGFADIGVVIHGSSGCYFYPASLLPNAVYGTHLLENDIIFGSEERLREVLEEVRTRHRVIAVVTTCVPSIVGEDLLTIPKNSADIIVEAPGFLGDFETGYRAALKALCPVVDPVREGINIDGLNPIDPYYLGNLRETERLLSLCGLFPGTKFSADTYESVFHAAPYTFTTNPDLRSNIGNSIGSLLGLEETEAGFVELSHHYPQVDINPVMDEIEHAEEQIILVCDKFLLRNDPPSVLIFSGAPYALFAARVLDKYLDADIIAIGSRTSSPSTPYPLSYMVTFEAIKACIQRERPDLVLGSSYEQSVCGDAAFVSFSFPMRGKILLRARTIAGPEGTLSLVEEVLNSCIDRKKNVIQSGT